MYNFDKILAIIIKGYNGGRNDDEAMTKYIAYHYKSVHDTRRKIKNLNQERSDAKKEYGKSVKTLNQKERDLQRLCRHLSTTFHPDASGNNDSETICDICEAVC